MLSVNCGTPTTVTGSLKVIEIGMTVPTVYIPAGVVVVTLVIVGGTVSITNVVMLLSPVLPAQSLSLAWAV